LILRRTGDEDGDPEQLLATGAEHWLVGTPAEAVARLEELADAGVERIYLQHLAHEDAELVELLGAEVAPLVS
jgi:alkanesulfonate monooxygenase SsuD/methylene tetrahydromethanopterin reductase-like flavin-dependent oxidoreductase (luciferase family)